MAKLDTVSSATVMPKVDEYLQLCNAQTWQSIFCYSDAKPWQNIFSSGDAEMWKEYFLL